MFYWMYLVTDQYGCDQWNDTCFDFLYVDEVLHIFFGFLWLSVFYKCVYYVTGLFIKLNIYDGEEFNAVLTDECLKSKWNNRFKWAHWMEPSGIIHISVTVTGLCT